MNYNTAQRVNRLSTETNELTYSLRKDPDQRKTKAQPLSDFNDRLDAAMLRLPAQCRNSPRPLRELAESEISMSSQDSLKLDRLLNEWTAVAASEEAERASKSKRFEELARPLVEELRQDLIANIYIEAEETRAHRAKQIEDLRARVREHEAAHAEHVAPARTALEKINNYSSIPTFKSAAADKPVRVDPQVLLQPLKDALMAELAAYEKDCAERMGKAWDTWRLLPDA